MDEKFSDNKMNDLIKETFSNRYYIKNKLGEGGMGSVFQVGTLQSEQMVFALKVLSKKEYNTYSSIYAEVHSLQDLDHLGIPQIIEVKEDSSFVYIIQEFIQGIDLKILMLKYGKVDEEIIVFWMRELAEILKYLHCQGVLHRDIKPGNIMLGNDGFLKIIDFGLARDLLQKDDADMKVMGTLAHTPPERYIRKNADEQTDIYGYGSTLYFLVTAEIPLSMKENPQHNMIIMMRKLKRCVSPAVFYIIKTCMAADPQERYRVFDEILYDVNRIDIYNKVLKIKDKKIKKLIFFAAISLIVGIFFMGISFFLL